ncbi:MAG TPA: C40 family peptidase [Thermoanaerobaculia bacterium]|nr:C40 family peptidase [Thermoanaerobaculia bacterium]
MLRKWLFIVLLAALPLRAQEAERRPGIIERALSWVGVSYRFGGSDEAKGFDCAGFVRRVFSTAGVQLPRSAATQFEEGCAVALDELQPGDLVFFRNTYKRGISHVGIYLGDNRFVHAASRTRSVVVDRFNAPYYLTHFAGARRISE